MKLRNKKTGEVVDFKIIADYDDCTSGWRLEKQDGLVLFYDHIDEIKEDWEDYVPKEPLIKDEKIRKAVRAWAEANSITQVSHDACWNAFRCTDFVIAFDYDFDRHDGFEDMKSYTIDELCGKEEE